MMTMTMHVHNYEETKSRTLYAMSAGDCSLAPPALLGISAAGDCLPDGAVILLSYADPAVPCPLHMSRALCR